MKPEAADPSRKHSMILILHNFEGQLMTNIEKERWAPRDIFEDSLHIFKDGTVRPRDAMNHKPNINPSDTPQFH